jgi:hypothetical protein
MVMPLRHSRASRWAAEEKRLKDQRPVRAQNRARVNNQQEIDALADLIVGRRRAAQLGSAWSACTYTVSGSRSAQLRSRSA